ncbi:Neurotransmitter-gated ion-channel ligand-binding domain-containing protein [Dirofilaria immitis]|nr:Neurotransmitter-gated ion-channel ligand-binding domain-containing protein [Dirofilaria immitis]
MRFHSDESSSLLLLRNMSSMHRLSRISVNYRNDQKPRKNHYQKSIILQNYPISDESKTKEHFLIRAERSIYEGEPMSDDEVEAECRLWARTLPHLRCTRKSEITLMSSHLSNKGQQRRKSEVDKAINKMREEKVRTLGHTLTSAFTFILTPTLYDGLLFNDNDIEHDIETLNRHQFEILEQCLYYYLAAEAQRKTQYFSAIQSLAAFPPDNVGLKGSRNEFLRNLNINGYIVVFWEDNRLRWNEEQWKLKIGNQFPVRNGDLMEIRRLSINSNGTVRAIINFSLRTFCDDSDFKNFPNDMYKCCYQIEPHVNQGGIEFTTSGRPVFTDVKYFRDYGWYVSGSTPTVQIIQDSQVPQVGFCLNLKRSAKTLHIELSLPNTITSILFLLTPLLGQIHLQIFAKIAILEFATIINMFSITVSTIIWMCSKIRRNLPPWNWLIRTSEVINRCICVFNAMDNSISLNEHDKSSPSNSYQEDWINAFLAIHGVSVCVLSLVFILGYLILS